MLRIQSKRSEIRGLIKFSGPIVRINAAGTTIIVLNDRKVAHDLLDLQAADTSNRARIIVGDLMTGGLMISFLNPGPLYV